jgi:hypothetical protein
MFESSNEILVDDVLVERGSLVSDVLVGRGLPDVLHVLLFSNCGL